MNLAYGILWGICCLSSAILARVVRATNEMAAVMQEDALERLPEFSLPVHESSQFFTADQVASPSIFILQDLPSAPLREHSVQHALIVSAARIGSRLGQLSTYIVCASNDTPSVEMWQRTMPGATILIDANGELASALGAYDVPAVYIFDRERRLVSSGSLSMSRPNQRDGAR